MKYGQTALMGFLLLAVLASGIGVVYAKYISRKYFVELQVLLSERDAVDIEWGRLQLEQSTWGTHGRVERLAHKKLDMHMPVAQEVVIITP